MLQDIGSARGIAHAITNRYWPNICTKYVEAAAALVANFEEDEVILGEYTFADGSLLNWVVSAYEVVNQRSVILEFSSVAGGSVSSRTILTMTDMGEIDRDRTNASDSTLLAPTMPTFTSNIRAAECFNTLLTTDASTIVNKTNSFVLKAGAIVKG